jgi:hypothetical protein
MIWTPDFCVGQPCRIEISRDWSTVTNVLRYCQHHQSIKDSGLADQQVFRAILQSCRVKESGRYAVKQELGLDKQHPGVPYSVATDGSILIRTDRAAMGWVREDGTAGPVPNYNLQDRERARQAASLAMGTVERPSGTSLVAVD